MKKTALLLSFVGTLLVANVPLTAQRMANLKPSEQVWVPAPTPKDGVSWAVLESTKEVQRNASGIIYSKPAFSPQVKALAGKRIKVNGYMMPLETSAKQKHFVLLGYPPDCPFHLSPAPTQFIEIRVAKPLSVSDAVRTIEGTLVLGGADESGIFYKIVDGREI
jgi:hypothetical protein